LLAAAVATGDLPVDLAPERVNEHLRSSVQLCCEHTQVVQRICERRMCVKHSRAVVALSLTLRRLDCTVEPRHPAIVRTRGEASKWRRSRLVRHTDRRASHGRRSNPRGTAPRPSPGPNETLAGKGHDAPSFPPTQLPHFPCCGGPHSPGVWSREGWRLGSSGAVPQDRPWSGSPGPSPSRRLGGRQPGRMLAAADVLPRRPRDNDEPAGAPSPRST
jgi:hypothetical protein